MSDQEEKRGKFQAIIRRQAEAKARDDYNKFISELQKISSQSLTVYLKDYTQSLNYYAKHQTNQIIDEDLTLSRLADHYEEEMSNEIYAKIVIVPKAS